MKKQMNLIGHLTLSKKGRMAKYVPVHVPLLQESVYQLFQCF